MSWSFASENAAQAARSRHPLLADFGCREISVFERVKGRSKIDAAVYIQQASFASDRLGAPKRTIKIFVYVRHVVSAPV
jgi:hypothetical protein